MAYESENFHLSGPLHLTHSDWDDANYQRSVAACLVQGVKVSERDRQKKRLGPKALAPLWWEYFHFQLLHLLIDDADSSIFGAIYKYCAPSTLNHHSANQPHIVVAFRGTMIKKKSFAQDLILDLRLILHDLRSTSRFETAMLAVCNMVEDAGDSRVWLAGYSLGSAIAMLVGKDMARSGIFLQSFLFNPPYFSAPLEQIKCPKLKNGVRVAKTIVKAGFAFTLKMTSKHSQQLDRAMLSVWLPNLFVNQADHICSEYIGHFEHRKMLVENGAGAVVTLAGPHSIASLGMKVIGKETEAVKLIPSANLVVNVAPCLKFKTAHELRQWWQPGAQLQSKIYQHI